MITLCYINLKELYLCRLSSNSISCRENNAPLNENLYSEEILTRKKRYR